MRLAAAKPCCFFRISRAGVAVVAAAGRRPWRAAAASGNADAKGGGRGDEEGQSVSAAGSSRRARLSARRRERIRLVDVVVEDGGGAVGGIGEFLRQPAGVESLLNTRALQSFAAVDPPEANTFRCTLQSIGFLGFQVAPVLDLRVTPTCHDCTVEMLSCRFEGSGSVEQQNELFSAFMSNHITWKDDGEEPCLDIDVNLEVTLELVTGVHEAIQHASIVSSGDTRQPADAGPPGQARALAGGAAAERLPFVGSASAAEAAWNFFMRNC